MPAKKMPERKKKLILLGTAPNRKDAPFGDKDVTIWGTGGTVNLPDVPRVDVAFELHPRRYWGRPEVMRILKQYGGTLIMADHYDEFPKSARLPIEKLREEFYIPTMGRCLYVTNTVAYMFMLAYLEGYKDIECYGVWMEHESEYDHQRTNVEYYIGYLTAKGVKITLHEGQVLKGHFEYGIEEPTIVSTLVDEGTALKNTLNKLDKEMDEKRRDYWMQEGAIRYNANLRRQFGGY